MQRKTPGIMLRDILRGDPQAEAVAEIIAETSPDILLLQGVDYDADLHGVAALRDLISARGQTYDHLFALRPNTGMATDLDLNGDGKTRGPADAQGFGYFAGQRGMAILSRWPIQEDAVQDFSALLWRDLPGATLPFDAGQPFPSAEVHAAQRLSSTGHWIVPIDIPGQPPLHLMAFAATPPVFDGPEDRNGLRNADEILLWDRVLNGELGKAPQQRFFILGTANLDPEQGEGRHEAILTLLSHPKLQDPQPKSVEGGVATVDWRDPSPGDLRVGYVLPSVDWEVTQAGVLWPEDNSASRHRLIWIDVKLPNAKH